MHDDLLVFNGFPFAPRWPLLHLSRFACVVSSVLRASMSRWVDTDDSTARSAPQSVTRAYKYIRSSSSDLCHVRCLAGPASLPGKRKHFPSYFLTLSNSSSFTLILPPSLADFFSPCEVDSQKDAPPDPEQQERATWLHKNDR